MALDDSSRSSTVVRSRREGTSFHSMGFWSNRVGGGKEKHTARLMTNLALSLSVAQRILGRNFEQCRCAEASSVVKTASWHCQHELTYFEKGSCNINEGCHGFIHFVASAHSAQTHTRQKKAGTGKSISCSNSF